MTTEQPDPSNKPDPCKTCSDDGGCEPGLINDLKCKPDGIAAQAKANAANQPEVIAAQDTFDKTRRDYRDARQLYSHDVHDLKHEICSLVERIRCKFKQCHVADCIDEAHKCIVERLKKCAEAEPSLNCKFDTNIGNLGDTEFQQRKKQYENDLAQAKAHFLKLSNEPADLAKRVADAKAELAKVNTEYAGDPATTDIKEVYAHALVLHGQIKKLWNGFENYTEYADMLCVALVCWTESADAVAILAGQDAVRTCHKNADKKRCEDLAANTVKEILAHYERICGHDHEKDDKSDECDEEESEECSECVGESHEQIHNHSHGHCHGHRGSETEAS